MTAENAFPKAGGDILYASEANYQAGDFTLATAGEAITAGNVVYIKQSDGKIYKSDTGTADDIRATGICPNAIDSAANGIVQVSGIYTTSSLTANKTYYLGASGAISLTRSGVQVGFSVSTTQLNIYVIQDDKDTIGIVKAYLKSFTNIPANNFTAFWVECNGQVLSDAESPLNGQTIPDLNGSSGTERFLRGQTTSGGTGGTEAHTHTVTANNSGAAEAAGGSDWNHTGLTVTSSSSGTLPSYYEVVWIMKIK